METSSNQSLPKLIKSFRYAFEGMYSATKTETNWKIGILEAVMVIIAGLYFQLSSRDWEVVIILIGLVLMAELLNSSVETIVDSFTQTQHPKAKLAKDFSAAAVVIMIITAGICGLIVFLPYLVRSQ